MGSLDALGSRDPSPGLRPLLKWAGGKSQLLPQIRAKVPTEFGKYIEPFLGGGAVYFDLAPPAAVISDANEELVSLYRTVASDPIGVAAALQKMPLGEDAYYEIRGQDITTLDAVTAAARTIYLNKTCFNGLFRVNRHGRFNVPYGKRKKVSFPSSEYLCKVAELLKGAVLLHGDYQKILMDYAQPGDFIFLDPPYVPVAKYSDFKRYTATQFGEDDHRNLAREFRRLADMGAYVVLTNSNHPMVHDLYEGFDVQVIETKRNINSRASGRLGQDVIVTARPGPRAVAVNWPQPNQVSQFPPTRYMGSKRQLLDEIANVTSGLEFETFVDLFAGSNVVSYLFKSMGKRVIANDFLAMSHQLGIALIANNSVRLTDAELSWLLEARLPHDDFVSRTFQGLYFEDEDNALIDQLRGNIAGLAHPVKRAIAVSALVRACVKKRPRGIFTYVGFRYDDGRLDLKTTLRDHFIAAVKSINAAVFDNGRSNLARRKDALKVGSFKDALVYLDPPYFSPRSDNEYVRRYHFVEGLAQNWEGLEIQESTLTKKFKAYPTPFSTRQGAYAAFESLFKRHRDSHLLVSYASNGLPTLDEIVDLLQRFKRTVDVHRLDHRYSFGNQGHLQGNKNNAVEEYLFVAY